MFLYLKRSQRQTWLGGRRYVLAAHVQTEAEELRLIQTHAFSEKVAYIVSLDHVHELERRAEATYQLQKRFSVWKEEDVGKIAWANAKVVALALRANYARVSAFRVTISDLVAGVVVEAPNIEELLGTEASIQKSFDVLQRLVDHAAAFEQDNESVFAPDGRDDDHVAPPSTWPRFGQR